jgi:hypothetical protein
MKVVFSQPCGTTCPGAHGYIFEKRENDMRETKTVKQLFLLIQRSDKLAFKELLIYSYLVWRRRYGKPTTLHLLRKEFGFRPGKIEAWVARLQELGLVGDDLTALEPPAGWFNARAGSEWWDRLQYTPVGWPKKGQSWITLATFVKRKAGVSNTQVARQLGCTPSSVRNAVMTLRAKEQKVDEMVVFKEAVKPLADDFGKPWLEAKFRGWYRNGGYQWYLEDDSFTRHCLKIQEALKGYPSAKVENLWRVILSKMAEYDHFEHFICNFGICWKLIINASNQVPTFSFVETGLLRQADNLVEYARTHSNYLLWEPFAYTER